MDGFCHLDTESNYWALRTTYSNRSDIRNFNVSQSRLKYVNAARLPLWGLINLKIQDGYVELKYIIDLIETVNWKKNSLSNQKQVTKRQGIGHLLTERFQMIGEDRLHNFSRDSDTDSTAIIVFVFIVFS